MKKFVYFLFVTIVMTSTLISCGNKKENKIDEPKTEELKTPVTKAPDAINNSVKIDPAKCKKVTYFAADFNTSSVKIDVDLKTFSIPTVIRYSEGKNSFTYELPKEFKVWKCVYDSENTVWLAGFYKGQYKEYVFYGKTQYKGKKITPNSFRGKAGTITYRK